LWCYFLTEEAYGMLEALWSHPAPHGRLPEDARKTHHIPPHSQALGDGGLRALAQAILERRLVRQVGQVLGPLGAQFTTKRAGRL